MIVADTNVIAYLLIPGDRTAEAEAARRRDPSWHAPQLWRSELRNVLWQYVRQEQLTLAEAQSLYADRRRVTSHDVDDLDVLGIAYATGCTAYDAEFVALARHLDAMLVTADRRLVAAAPDVAVALTAFASGAGDSGAGDSNVGDEDRG